MTGQEMRAIRDRLGMSAPELAHALGMSGKHVRVSISRYERGERTIPDHVARLVRMFDRHGVPAEFRGA